MATSDFVKECDYLGIVSGNKEPDKIKKAGFTVSKSEFVDAPIINELPMVLECEVIKKSDSSDYIVGNIIRFNFVSFVFEESRIISFCFFSRSHCCKDSPDNYRITVSRNFNLYSSLTDYQVLFFLYE